MAVTFLAPAPSAANARMVNAFLLTPHPWAANAGSIHLVSFRATGRTHACLIYPGMGVASGPAEAIYVTYWAASLVSRSFTTPNHHPPPGKWGTEGGPQCNSSTVNTATMSKAHACKPLPIPRFANAAIL